jgi:hypothetical protein
MAIVLMTIIQSFSPLAVLLLLLMALHDVLAVADGQNRVEASVISRL